MSPETTTPLTHNVIQKTLRHGVTGKELIARAIHNLSARLGRPFVKLNCAAIRSRGCETALAEDLAQEVMLTVYRKAAQIRDRKLFRAWLFKVARHALCRHYGKQTREVETIGIDISDVGDRLVAAGRKPGGTTAFEFLHWMAFLDSRERETMTLRFIEQWEYHEIAAIQAMPIGTVQWRVFNAKKKLAPHLASRQNNIHKAA